MREESCSLCGFRPRRAAPRLAETGVCGRCRAGGRRRARWWEGGDRHPRGPLEAWHPGRAQLVAALAAMVEHGLEIPRGVAFRDAA